MLNIAIQKLHKGCGTKIRICFGYAALDIQPLHIYSYETTLSAQFGPHAASPKGLERLEGLGARDGQLKKFKGMNFVGADDFKPGRL